MDSVTFEIKNIDSIKPSSNTPAFHLAVELIGCIGTIVELNFDDKVSTFIDGQPEIGTENKYQIVLPDGGGCVSFEARVVDVCSQTISLLIMGNVRIGETDGQCNGG